MRPHRARRSAFAALVAVALLFPLASCDTSPTQSQSSAPTTSAPTTSAAPTTTADTTTACADVAALKSSLENLTKVKPAEDGVTALTTAIAGVKTSLDKAEASASPVLQPSVQQVKTTFAELQTAASGITADNLKQKAPAIAAALKQVATARQALSSTLRAARGADGNYARGPG
jgi:phage-related protein